MLRNQKLLWRGALMVALLMLAASSGGHGVWLVITRVAWIGFLLGLVYFAVLLVRALAAPGRVRRSGERQQ